jgi:hypothetical protein
MVLPCWKIKYADTKYRNFFSSSLNKKIYSTTPQYYVIRIFRVVWHLVFCLCVLDPYASYNVTFTSFWTFVIMRCFEEYCDMHKYLFIYMVYCELHFYILV